MIQPPGASKAPGGSPILEIEPICRYNLPMSIQLIQQYHSKVERIIRYGGSRKETAVSAQTLLWHSLKIGHSGALDEGMGCSAADLEGS